MVASHPVDATPSQSAKPAMHPATRQSPAEQTTLACGRTQLTPQAPQFRSSVAVS